MTDYSRLTEQQRLNTLTTNSPVLLERRIKNIEAACFDQFLSKLQQTLGEKAKRFSGFRVIIDSVHEVATLRSDCTGVTDGKRCGVRATAQVVKEDGKFRLSDAEINFDRCENNPCADCQSQCCRSHVDAVGSMRARV